MARVNIVLPAMGEGVIEATVNKWLVSPGKEVKEDDPVVEVATDKVDSEVTAPVSGTIVEIVASEGSVPHVGDVIAILETHSDYKSPEPEKVEKEVIKVKETIETLKKEVYRCRPPDNECAHERDKGGHEHRQSPNNG